MDPRRLWAAVRREGKSLSFRASRIWPSSRAELSANNFDTSLSRLAVAAQPLQRPPGIEDRVGPLLNGWIRGRAAQGALPRLVHDLFQLQRVQRLGQMAVHAGLQTALPVAGAGIGRQGHDRDAPPRGGFFLPDRPGRFQTVHLGHLHVHEDQVVGLSGQLGQRLGPTAGNFDLVTLTLQQVDAHLLVEEVVFDQQDPQGFDSVMPVGRCSIPQWPRLRELGSGLLVGPRHGDGERKGASLADFAVHLDTAAHDLDQPGGDAQTQAGAAVFLAQRAIGLDKRIENGPELVRGYADAGVAYFKRQD